MPMAAPLHFPRGSQSTWWRTIGWGRRRVKWTTPASVSTPDCVSPDVSAIRHCGNPGGFNRSTQIFTLRIQSVGAMGGLARETVHVRKRLAPDGCDTGRALGEVGLECRAVIVEQPEQLRRRVEPRLTEPDRHASQRVLLPLEAPLLDDRL